MLKQEQNLRRSSRLQTKNTAKSETEEGLKFKTTRTEIMMESPPENPVEAELYNKAFGNHLVLSTIMKKLRTRDLINCRLVNSSWKEIASSILSKRDDLKAIEMRCEGNRKKQFLLNSYKNRKLKDLQRILENSKNFPCKNFKIEGPLDHPDMQKFLASCGPQIRKLNLDPTTYDVTVVDKLKTIPLLRKLLTEQVVNLNFLILDSFGFGYEDLRPTEKLFPSPVSLPALNNLQIEHYFIEEDAESRWMEELVNAAPNLKSFSRANIWDDVLKFLVKQKKPYLLIKMNYDAFSCNDQILHKFKLKKLSQNRDDGSYPRTGYRGDPTRTQLPKILNLNVDTLTNISMEWSDAVDCLPTTKVFQHVKIFGLIGLEFRVGAQNWNKIPLQDLFPNLDTIRLVGIFNAKTTGGNVFNIDKDLHTEDDFPFVPSEPVTKSKLWKFITAVMLSG